MREVTKYLSLYVPVLNRAFPFKRENATLSVKLKDEDVYEIGSEHLKSVFPSEYSVYNVKVVPMKSEQAWMITANVKDWE